MIPDVDSLRSWPDFARKCFCFGSEAVNASGEAVRGLVKRRVGTTGIIFAFFGDTSRKLYACLDLSREILVFRTRDYQVKCLHNLLVSNY